MNNTGNYYQYHLFFCLNQKEAGRQCCYGAGAEAMYAYAKARLEQLGVGKRVVRVNKAGCLGRCSEGPALVIYPEGVWYSYQTQADIDEIIQEHLIHGKLVERLKL